MPRKLRKYVCINCSIEYESRNKDSKFCSSSCSASYGNKHRELSEEAKKNISDTLKAWNEKQKTIKPKKKGEKTPKNLLDMSKRTISKVMERLNIPCSRCGWVGTICDIHHINGRNIDNPDNNSNLTYLCPNCHRMVHKGLIKKEDLVTIKDQIGDKWLDHYYG